MSGLDKNRFRNKTISFRMSPDERRLLNSRVVASGMPKGQFFIEMLLKGSINIRVGKYESDRLSLEIRMLKEYLDDNSYINNMQAREITGVEQSYTMSRLLKKWVENG